MWEDYSAEDDTAVHSEEVTCVWRKLRSGELQYVYFLSNMAVTK